MDAIVNIIVTLIIAIIMLAVFYALIQQAIISGLRRARREQWTETYDVKHARWLTQEQRDTLVTRAPQV